jgi:putative aldouronate transport system permease protein
MTAEQATAARPRRPSRRARLRRDLVYLAMGLPGLALLAVFSYVPMAGAVLAFQDYRPAEGVFGSAWVGLQNFAYLFATSAAWNITRNTVVMNVIFIIVNLTVALTLAILLSEVRDRTPRLAKFYQSTMFLPYVLSYVAITGFVLAFLDPKTGLLNQVVEFFGGSPVGWYQDPQYWPVILTVVSAFKGVGFWVIVYLAAILAMNPAYFEAAAIDGATRWQRIRLITLPLLAPLVVLNLLLAVGGIFNADFGLFFQVTLNSTPLYPTTDVIDTFVYRSLTSLGNVGMAAAAGLYQSFVGFVLVIGANWLARRRNSDGALF